MHVGGICMRIAVSACLLDETCRYDGRSKPCARVQELAADGHELVPICPEVAGGLPTPRTPCEIVQAPWMESGKARMADEHAWTILDASGTDCTAAYARGAQAELARAKEAGCELTILKAKSPSCGSGGSLRRHVFGHARAWMGHRCGHIPRRGHRRNRRDRRLQPPIPNVKRPTRPLGHFYSTGLSRSTKSSRESEASDTPDAPTTWSAKSLFAS